MDRTQDDFSLSGDVIFYSASLRKGKPYVARFPRNHESLFIVTSGNLLYESGGKRQVVRCGEVGYIPRGNIDVSSAYGCDEVSYMSAKFNVSANERDFFASLPFEVLAACGDTAKYEKLFSIGLSAYISNQKGHELVCCGILLQIVGLLFGERGDKKSVGARTRKILPALGMIENRFSDSSLRITELADSCCMSVKNFRRIFFEEKEENPYEYLQKFRIAKAEILLANTSESVTDIAVMCGFSDLYSFSHAFRKHTGTSPAGYRRTRI